MLKFSLAKAKHGHKDGKPHVGYLLLRYGTHWAAAADVDLGTSVRFQRLLGTLQERRPLLLLNSLFSTPEAYPLILTRPICRDIIMETSRWSTQPAAASDSAPPPKNGVESKPLEASVAGAEASHVS
jgi:hypothetical protein